jgi:acyl-coenzyme A thioesterase 13
MIEQFKQLIGKESKETSPSPLGRWLNGTLLAVSEGTMTVSFIIRDEMTNPAGIMHGGVAAAMMDEVIGMTTYSLGNDAFFAAASLNVDFLRPGRNGETIKVVSEIIRAGKTMVHVECRIYNEAGKLISKATSNMVKTNF